MSRPQLREPARALDDEPVLRDEEPDLRAVPRLAAVVRFAEPARAVVPRLLDEARFDVELRLDEELRLEAAPRLDEEPRLDDPAALEDFLLAPLRRRGERPVPLRSAAGISAVTTAFVSTGIWRARKLAIRSSSRRICRASFAVSVSESAVASVSIAV